MPLKKARRFGIFSLLPAIAVTSALVHWTIHRREQVRLAERLRQQRITQSLIMLRKSFPQRVFAACNTDSIPIAFQADFHEADVRSVTLSPSEDGVTASVGLVGIKQENQAPTIYVALYDERGAVLARSPVVNFTFALLAYGDRQEIKDQIKLPKNADPAIVSVDNPKSSKTRWGSDE